MHPRVPNRIILINNIKKEYKDLAENEQFKENMHILQ